MEIPDDDSDLLGTSADELTTVLQNRDEVIKHALIPDLKPDTHLSPEELDLRAADFCRLASVRQRISAVFCPRELTAGSELCKQGQRALYYPPRLGILIGIGMGIYRTNTAHREYVCSTRLSSWQTTAMAKRRAFDYALLRGTAYGLTTAFKASVCAFGFWTLPLLFSAINGKTSFWEYAAGICCANCLCCFNQGTRCMLVFSVLGAIPGFAIGFYTMWFSRKLNLTFEQLYKDQVRDALRHSPHWNP